MYICLAVCHIKAVNFILSLFLTGTLCFPPDYEAWKKRADMKGSNYSVLGRTTGNLMTSAPAAQPVHGRVDWTSKYGGNR